MADGSSTRPVPGDLVMVGRIGRAHGVHGQVFVRPWTDDPERRFAAGAVLRTDRTDPDRLTVEVSALHSGRLVVRFAGVSDRGSATALNGIGLLIPADERDALVDPDEFYDSDLLGLSAVRPDGHRLGSVRDVVHTPAEDYLVLDLDGREQLIPFVSAIVPTVDLEAGRVVVDPPEGLLEL